MRVLAAQATVAIENARLVETLQATQADLERRVEERTAEFSDYATLLRPSRRQASQFSRRSRRRSNARSAVTSVRP
jgi:GAF domain-containing protein